MSKQLEQILHSCGAKRYHSVWIEYYTQNAPHLNNIKVFVDDTLNQKVRSLPNQIISISSIKKSISGCQTVEQLETALAIKFQIVEPLISESFDFVDACLSTEYDQKYEKYVFIFVLRTFIQISFQFPKELSKYISGESNVIFYPNFWQIFPKFFTFFMNASDNYVDDFCAIFERITDSIIGKIAEITKMPFNDPFKVSIMMINTMLMKIIKRDIAANYDSVFKLLYAFYAEVIYRQKGLIPLYLTNITNFYQLVLPNIDVFPPPFVISCSTIATEMLSIFAEDLRDHTYDEYFNAGILCLNLQMYSQSQNAAENSVLFIRWVLSVYLPHDYNFSNSHRAIGQSEITKYEFLKVDDYLDQFSFLPESVPEPTALKSTKELAALAYFFGKLVIKTPQAKQIYLNLIETVPIIPSPHRQFIVGYMATIAKGASCEPNYDSFFDDKLFDIPHQTFSSKIIREYTDQLTQLICVFVRDTFTLKPDQRIRILNSINLHFSESKTVFIEMIMPLLSELAFNCAGFDESFTFSTLCKTMLQYMTNKFNTYNGMQIFSFFQVLALERPTQYFISSNVNQAFVALCLEPIYSASIFKLYLYGLRKSKNSNDTFSITLFSVLANLISMYTINHSNLGGCLQFVQTLQENIPFYSESKIKALYSSTIIDSIVNFPSVFNTLESLMACLNFLELIHYQGSALSYKSLLHTVKSLGLNEEIYTKLFEFAQTSKLWLGLFVSATAGTQYQQQVLDTITPLILSSSEYDLDCSKAGMEVALLETKDPVAIKCAYHIFSQYPSPTVFNALKNYSKEAETSNDLLKFIQDNIPDQYKTIDCSAFGSEWDFEGILPENATEGPIFTLKTKMKKLLVFNMSYSNRKIILPAQSPIKIDGSKTQIRIHVSPTTVQVTIGKNKPISVALKTSFLLFTHYSKFLSGVKFIAAGNTILDFSLPFLTIFEKPGIWNSFINFIYEFDEDTAFDLIKRVFQGSAIAQNQFKKENGFETISGYLKAGKATKNKLLLLLGILSTDEIKQSMISHVWLRFSLWSSPDYYMKVLPSLISKCESNFVAAFEGIHFKEYCESGIEGEETWSIVEHLIFSKNSTKFFTEMLDIMRTQKSIKLVTKVLEMMKKLISSNETEFIAAVSSKPYVPFIDLLQIDSYNIQYLSMFCLSLSSNFIKMPILSEILIPVLSKIPINDADDLFVDTCDLFFGIKIKKQTTKFLKNDAQLQIKNIHLLPLISYFASFANPNTVKRGWSLIVKCLEADIVAAVLVSEIKLWPYWIFLLSKEQGFEKAVNIILGNSMRSQNLQEIMKSFIDFEILQSLVNFNANYIEKKLLSQLMDDCKKDELLPSVIFTLIFLHTKITSSTEPIFGSKELFKRIEQPETMFGIVLRNDQSDQWVDSDLSDTLINILLEKILIDPEYALVFNNARIYGIDIIAYILGSISRINSFMSESVVQKFNDIIDSNPKIPDELLHSSIGIIIQCSKEVSSFLKLLEKFYAFKDNEDSFALQLYLFEEKIIQNKKEIFNTFQH